MFHSTRIEGRLSRFAFLAGTLLALGCGGARSSSDHAGDLNQVLRIAPGGAILAVGQTIRFQAASPWGGGLQWSVLPPTAGSIDGDGLFSACAHPGTCTVLAVWSQDVRYTASATLIILAAPAPAQLSPGVVQSFGGLQTIPGTTEVNGAVVGEPLATTNAATADQFIQVRHGFLPPGLP